MNKKLVLLSSLVTIVSLSACNGNNSSSITPTNSNSGGDNKVAIENPWWTTDGSLSFDEDGKVELEDVEITLETVVNGPDLTTFQNLVEDFNEEYSGQIRVTANSSGEASFESQVAQRIEQNTSAPDLIMSHQKGHKWFADSELIQPFDEAINESGLEFDISNYMNVLGDLSDLGYEDTQFQVPIDARSFVILYNKDMLSDLGYDAPPASNAEWMEMCEAFKTKYPGNDYRAISIPQNEHFFYNYVFNTALIQNGVELYDEEDYHVHWTDEANKKGFENARKAINTLYDKKYLNYNEDDSTGQTRFYNNKSLFLFCLPWNVSSILKGYATTNKISEQSVKDNFVNGATMANLFAITDGVDTGEAIYGDSHAFIMSKTVTDINEKVACLIFVKWFTENASAGAEWAEAGHSTVSHTIANDEKYNQNAFVTQYINEFYLDLNQFVTVGNNPHYSDLISILQTLTTQLTNSTTSLDSILQESEQELNDIIDFSNLFG